jgi:hypothetical protein
MRPEQATHDLMRGRENIAARLDKQSRQLRRRFSGACSFRDFCGSELRQIDQLVNCGETGRTLKYNAQIVFV